MADAITLDVTDQLNTFNKLASSMPFIISKSMNDLSFQKGREASSKQMKKDLTQRNKSFFAPSKIRVKKSHKNNLQVQLFHFKEELGLQQFGGTEMPEGNKLAIPVRKNLSKYANVPNNKNIPKALKIDNLMKNAPRQRVSKHDSYKVKGVRPFIGKRGVYIRTPNGLRLLYVFLDKAKHRKKLLDFQIAIERTFNVNLERYIERQYLRLLRG